MNFDHIPKGWELINIKSTCEILDHKRIPLNSDERYSIKGNIPYYGANGVIDYINNYIFDEDLILMAEDGGHFDEYETRPVAYRVFGKSWINNHAHVLRVKSSYDFDYIFYSLQHKNVIPFIKGGTRSKLNQAELREVSILLPISLKEQQKIASILQSIDNTINKTRELIEKYKMIKQGLMQDLFTRGINKNFKIGDKDIYDFKNGRIKIYVDGWTVKTMKELSRNIIDGTHFTPKYTEFGIPFLRVTDIQKEKIDLNNVKHISLKEHKTLTKRCNPQKNDILYSKNGTVGIAKLIDWNWEFSIFVSLCLIKVRYDIIDPIYLKNVLESDIIKKQIVYRSKQMTVNNLHLEEINEFLVPFPISMDEQERIVSIMEEINNKIHIEQNYLDKMTRIKQGLMQDLLTGKVRVKVEECQENSHM
jgi:type I restriction enzyme S subunit